MRRVFGLCLIFLSLSLVFTNCSQYSDDGLTDSSSLIKAGTGDVTAYQGITVLNGEQYMNCFEDHIQVGGRCNTADSLNNYIEYSLSRDGNPIPWLGTTPVYKLQGAKCENGHWFAVVPKPNDPVLGSGNQMLQYDLSVQIYTNKTGVSWEAGERAPAYTFSIQQAGACAN